MQPHALRSRQATLRPSPTTTPFTRPTSLHPPAAPTTRSLRTHTRTRSTARSNTTTATRGRPLQVLSFRENDPKTQPPPTPQQQQQAATATTTIPETRQAPATPQRRVVQLRPEEDPSIAALEVGTTVLGIILGGGAGEKLWPLASRRAKPAVPVGANYRLIDIAVSNCLNSGLQQVYCLTQHNSASLNRHLQQVYQQTSRSAFGTHGFVEALPASPTTFTSKWAQGSADAVKLHMWVFEEAIQRGVEDLLVMSGDHLYRMDYRFLLRAHRQTGADITIAALPADAPHAPDLGLLKVDGSDGWRVTEFVEKPGRGEVLGTMSVDTADLFGLPEEDAHERPYIASMGVYAIKARALKQLLMDQCRDCRDFGSEVIPAAQEAGLRLHAFPYTGYWQNLSTVAEYYSASMALTAPPPATPSAAAHHPMFDLYNQRAPLLTLPMLLPPSKVADAELDSVLLGDGTLVGRGSRVGRSVLGVRSVVGKYCVVEDSVLMGADYYETKRDLALSGSGVPMGIGDGCTIKKAIIDKNARLGKGCALVNKEGITEGGDEKRGWVVVDGIIVVLKDATLQPGTVV